jgi:hypothetical protein
MRYDYVIAGGGSAGCTLAARLSEDPSKTVCLIEAGGEGRNLLVRAPAGIIAMLPGRPKINNWAFETVDADADRRQHQCADHHDRRKGSRYDQGCLIEILVEPVVLVLPAVEYPAMMPAPIDINWSYQLCDLRFPFRHPALRIGSLFRDPK